jgi:UDP-N-acetylmuramoylalanine--D-glutamate ligase
LKNNYRNELQNAGIEFEEGMHNEERILDADEVMKSPGIPNQMH